MWGGATSKGGANACNALERSLKEPEGDKSNRGNRWTGNSLLPMVLEGSSLPESPSWTSRWRTFCETESDIKRDGLEQWRGIPYLGAIRLA